jgi:acyl transferase domain-containing protein/thioesterase domain-containing protein/acyl carrier protein
VTALADQSVDANDIAIIGMALRVPGARTVREFWDNLRTGTESIRTLTPDELKAAGERPENLRKSNYVPRTADLPGMEMFDAEFFGLGPKDAAIMDPQHRQFLECAWEAMEDATRPPSTVAGPVGVFAGCGMGSYFYFNVCSHRKLVEQTGMFLLRHTGNDKDFLATRVSYAFDLKGPSLNIQSACSTSLVAVHYACQSLLAGECDMALAGGVTIELPHRRGYLYADGEILSPDGHCRAFDHRSAGTVFGSGAGVVVLRRLADALRDGDPIRAVIKATAVNNDGAGKAGYLAPSIEGQAAAVVEALALAGVAADSVQYVECHGTGTYLGDPIEIAALTQAFRQTTDRRGFCHVGSVKTNIGHLDTAAGVVGLIKTALALEHGEIPPTLNFEKPNPAIDFAASPFVVADRLTPWPEANGPRRATVNSLGVGGTNAHAVLEAAPSRQPAYATPAKAKPHLLVLSAKSKAALDEASLRLARHLEANPDLPLADVAHTLANGRARLPLTRVVAVAGRTDAIAVLGDTKSRRPASHARLDVPPSAVFLFPGGGAQYPGMATALYRDEASFRSTVDEGLSYLPSTVSDAIREAWFGGAPDAAIAFLKPSLQLPAILIAEVALARLWMARGVRPAALIGHSMGENAAACVAGVLTFDRAVNLVRLRGELFDEIRGGGMLSVALSHDALVRRLPAALDVASVNAPELCVVSGQNEDLEAFRRELERDGIEASRVAIDIAAHSRALTPILARFEAFLRATPLSAPTIPIVSNRTGTWLSATEATDPLYWVGHLRNTVRFADGLATLAAEPGRAFIEVGPGRALSSLAKARGIPSNQVLNSLPHADETVDDRLHFLTAVGRASVLGLPATVDDLTGAETGRRVSLPTYAFQHQPYFLDRITEAPSDAEAPLTRIDDMANWGWRPAWKRSHPEVRLDADRTPARWLVFLDDAGLGDTIVRRLRSLGHDVVTVAPGDAFARLDDRRYAVCAEHGRVGYDALVQDLSARGGVPERIVHLALLTRDEAHRPGSSFFNRTQEWGFYSLFHLAQALGDAAPADRQITVVTNGLHRVGDEPVAHPEKATVLGPALVIPKELPGVTVRVIDAVLDETAAPPTAHVTRLFPNRGRDQAPERLATLLWDDLFADPGNEVVAWRRDKRWSLVREATRLPEASASSVTFRDEGVYLVTGGTGDLGGRIACDLAGKHSARLVLLGRTELPPKETWDDYLTAYGRHDRIGRTIATLRDIEEAGGTALYLRADVTNPQSLAAAVRSAKQTFGAIHGVLHTAGLVRDNLVALKSAEEAAEVLAPKVLGTMVLAEVLADEPLDVMVLFSSTSTDTAPAGQIDYVAANAYLNAFAESRAGRPGPKVVAVHWGIWADIGLAARSIEKGTEAGDVTVLDHMAAPLLDRRVREDRTRDRFEGRIDASTWVLDEHRLASGAAIWPGTGYIEVIVEALRARGVATAFTVEDLTFLRPLYVPDGEARTLRVEIETRNGTQAIAVTSEGTLARGTAPTRHAEASVRPAVGPAPTRFDVAACFARCSGRIERAGDTALEAAQARHLRFGPRWQVLREIAYGNSEAIARLTLPTAAASDVADGFHLHPALLDIATGYAMDLVPGYDAALGLWVPMSYGRLSVYGPLGGDIVSHVRLDAAHGLGAGYAAFDVTIADPQGRVLVEITRFVVKKLDAGVDLTTDERTPRGAANRHAETRELSPALARLAGQVELGIRPAEGFDALVRAMATGLPQVVVSSIDLDTLSRTVAAAANEAPTTAGFERPSLSTTYVAPRTPVETKLAGIWSELLGVEKIGVDDNFFDLGGHSLVAVRLFRAVKAAYAVDFPISVLFEAPTIAQCAALIEARRGSDGQSDVTDVAVREVAKPRFTHIVEMSAGADPTATPFFICAGMFGNVLNLRHLSLQIGRDRPVYALQARGLYGDQPPHEIFEEMARDYLAEIRSIQPHGPYLLGGFSGGGLVAYEMAQQLRAAGEPVGAVIMLDTPYPEDVTLSLADRVTMKLQDLKREGTGFVTAWAKRRIAWELARHQRESAPDKTSTEHFHDARIEAAFRRALKLYAGRPYGGRVHLLRPRLAVTYRLSDGRCLNAERSPLHADNGWSPYVRDLAIVEVPGDHDNMVLEPNVRVTAQHMREILNAATVRPVLPAMAAE